MSKPTITIEAFFPGAYAAEQTIAARTSQGARANHIGGRKRQPVRMRMTP